MHLKKKNLKEGMLPLIHEYYVMQSLLSVLTEGDHKPFTAIVNMPRRA